MLAPGYPLVPFELYDHWDGLGGGRHGPSLAVAILEFVDSVPEPAQRLLRRLVEMLQQVDSARTRMEPAALGTVFAPGGLQLQSLWRKAAATVS